MIWVESLVSVVPITGFGLKFQFQPLRFQDLARHVNLSGVDFRILVEILISAVSISGFGKKFRFQGFGFHDLG